MAEATNGNGATDTKGANGSNGTDPNANNQNQDPKGGGTDPAKKTEPATTDLDLTKLDDDAFGKVFDDPRLFNHPRFKQLNEQAKEAKTLKEQAAQREREEAEKRGEWEKIAKDNEAKAKEAEQRYTQATADNALTAAAAQAGVTDIDAALKLVDRSGVNVDSATGTVTGASEAIKSLVEARSYLTSTKQPPRVGSGTSPASGSSGGYRFKASQISDPKFFNEHEAEIMAAMKEPGGIVEDRPGR
jgi:hypothetical protein